MRQTHPVGQGRNHRVTHSLSSGPWTFLAGETAAVLRCRYSHYDNSFVYEFRNRSDGQTEASRVHETEMVTPW